MKYKSYKLQNNKMGIKNLHQFLRKKCPNVYSVISLSDLQYKKVAIDVTFCADSESAIRFCGLRARFFKGITLITFIIVPAVNNRSAPGQKHSHRWESPSCHWIGPRKFSKFLMVGKVGVLEDGLLGCCFRGFPGG